MEKNAVADQLHSAAIHLLRRLRLQDDASGLGPAKLSALSILVFAGPRSLGELAKMEQVKPPTMTRIVNGLESEGLIKRKTDAHDQRSTQIHATGKAVKILAAARVRRVQELAKRLDGLARAELLLVQSAASLIERILR